MFFKLRSHPKLTGLSRVVGDGCEQQKCPAFQSSQASKHPGVLVAGNSVHTWP